MKNDNEKCIISMFKSFICGTLISNFCFGTIMSANAVVITKGEEMQRYVNNVSFTMYNSLSTGREGSGSYKIARAYTSVEAEQNLGSKFMGVRPMLYDSSGNVVEYGDWHYTSSDNTAGIVASVTHSVFSGSPSFFSWGYVQIWDGYKYIEYRPPATGKLNNYSQIIEEE